MPFSTDLLIEQIHRISHRYSLQEGGSHGPDHSERVYYMALAIGTHMQADLFVLKAAALLHDIGRRAESESRGAVCHAQHSAELARAALQELQLSEETIEQICHCIRSHRFRKGEAPETLEARILFDADKLDSIGAIGIGRAYLFAGQIGARLHNPDKNPADTASYSIEDTAYREFQVKMSKVKNQMLTPLGKRIARRRHAFMETFFDELNREIYAVADGLDSEDEG